MPVVWLVPAIMLLVIGCRSDTVGRKPAGTGKRDARIAFIGPSETDPDAPFIMGGARRYLQDFSTVHLLPFQPEDDSVKALRRTVETALADEPDAICVYLAEAEGGGESLAKLLENRAVVTMGGKLPGNLARRHVRIDYFGATAILAEHLRELVADGRSYAVVYDDSTPAARRAWGEFDRIARQWYSVKRLAERSAPPTEQAAAVATILEQFRHTALVVTLDPRAWRDPQAHAALGPPNRFATVGSTPGLWKWLEERKAAGIVGPIHGQIGAEAVALAVEAVFQETGAGTERVVPSELITRETLPDFADRYAAAAGMEAADLLPD